MWFLPSVETHHDGMCITHCRGRNCLKIMSRRKGKRKPPAEDKKRKLADSRRRELNQQTQGTMEEGGRGRDEEMEGRLNHPPLT